MALKHYGGSTPSQGPSEWTCPQCQATNSVPLKAGCQSCGAKDGAGARKVEGVGSPLHSAGATLHTASSLTSELHALIAEEARKVEGPHAAPLPIVGPQIAGPVAADTAFRRWLTEAHGAVITESYEIAKEAFMAGVAWAQAQQGSQARPPLSLSEEILDRRLLGDVPNAGVASLYLAEAGQIPVVLDMGTPTLATILAALAFYRDHVLGYGTVPGHLDAEGVTDLLQRLSPQEAAQ